MNKYGGINDMENCDKRVYGLWYQMLRRCYDTTQQERGRGKSYADCTVSSRWHRLSNFANDIKHLQGYSDWLTKVGYCLDKDTKIEGNKEYSRNACVFIPMSDNIREANKRTKSVKKAQEANKAVYVLETDKVTLVFNSEKEACEFLGVRQCSVSSCYHKGYKCKGYKINCAKMDLESGTYKRAT